MHNVYVAYDEVLNISIDFRCVAEDNVAMGIRLETSDHHVSGYLLHIHTVSNE